MDGISTNDAQINFNLMTDYRQGESTIGEHGDGRIMTGPGSHWRQFVRPNLTKGQFSEAEDILIMAFVRDQTDPDFREITQILPQRSAKQCRERWSNHLRPGIRKGPWTPDEDNMIWQLWLEHPKQWSVIAASLPGRTDNAVKNRFNSSISKRIEVDVTGARILGPSQARGYRQSATKRTSKVAEERDARLVIDSVSRLSERRILWAPRPQTPRTPPVDDPSSQPEGDFTIDDFGDWSGDDDHHVSELY
jgi:hypothetical protein